MSDFKVCPTDISTDDTIIFNMTIMNKLCENISLNNFKFELNFPDKDNDVPISSYEEIRFNDVIMESNKIRAIEIHIPPKS